MVPTSAEGTSLLTILSPREVAVLSFSVLTAHSLLLQVCFYLMAPREHLSV